MQKAFTSHAGFMRTDVHQKRWSMRWLLQPREKFSRFGFKEFTARWTARCSEFSGPSGTYRCVFSSTAILLSGGTSLDSRPGRCCLMQCFCDCHNSSAAEAGISLCRMWEASRVNIWCFLHVRGISKSFRSGRPERKLQMIQLSATGCSCMAILWVSLASFAAVTLCVASELVFVVYFVIASVRKLLDTPSYHASLLPFVIL
jgi:hypothetical protein